MFPPNSPPPDFSMSQARTLMGTEIFKPKAWIYFTDFLLCIGIGAVLFHFVRVFVGSYGLFSWQVVLTFTVQCVLFYRAVTFIHELTHLPREGFGPFRFAWNLLCGIPFLMPSFVYHTHADHHRRKHYGTKRDGEYLPLGNRHPIYIVGYLAEVFILGPLAVVRWLVLTPLTWLHPAIRDFVHARASSMVINPLYMRPLPDRQTLRMIRLQELGCFLWCLGVVLVPLFAGNLMVEWNIIAQPEHWWQTPPIPFVIHAYITSVAILLVNSLRTVASHRWYNEWNKPEPEMTFTEQLLDSVNFPHRPWFTELWGPIGMRYHALHHLFPSLPYHSMPQAHRRLMEGLPADSPYRETNEPSMFSSLADLWRRASRSSQGTGKKQTPVEVV